MKSASSQNLNSKEFCHRKNSTRQKENFWLKIIMDWLFSFLKLEHKHYNPVMFGISIFLGTVAAGFLIIFQFKPELVERYDVLKLFIFSCALTLPLVSINAVATSFLYDRLTDDYDNETENNVDIPSD